jgi:hypothetical protein
LLESQRRRELFRNRGELSGGAATICICCQRFEEALRRYGADEEVRGAGAHCLDRNRDGVTMGENDNGQVRTVLAKRRNQLWSALGIPASEQHGEHFAAVRPLEEGSGHFFVSGANDAPSGTASDRRDEPTLLGI